MATISKLKPDQVLYELRSQKMGNTTQSRRACFTVRVISIAPDGGSIQASWNGNAPSTYYRRDVAALRVKKPEPKGKIFGLPSY